MATGDAMTPSAEIGPAEAAVLSKAAWRLIPFAALLYFVSFLDRVNVSYAALTMNRDIGLSASAYGMGAGIFFIGYCLFEVPSNLILKRVGARIWIARIMISWGLVSAGMAFVEGPTSFWIMRFLLGVAEAGFFPGIILYLSFWFPSAVRGRVIGYFMLAIPVSSVIGAPVSTALLQTSVFGLEGWRTMFIVEGIPAILLGITVFFFLTNRPGEAKWLTPEERLTLETLIERDRHPDAAADLRTGLLSPQVWRLAIVYFGLVMGLYGFGFWAPQIIRSLGEMNVGQVGWITMVPYAFAALAMYLCARHSDASGERIGHIAVPAFLGGLGFLASAILRDPFAIMAALTLGAVGVYAALSVFWTLPTSMLAGTAAAGGIALINSIGNLAGYLGPFAIGKLKDATGGYGPGLTIVAASLSIAGLAVMSFKAFRTASGAPAKARSGN
jgi:ACS family tartrate transporter-like MFS transporter